MLRTFHEHDIRHVDALDGRWQFIIAADRRDRGRLPRAYPRTIQVPSAWETVPGLERYRGKAWYRTLVPAVAGTALRLVFGGVSHTGTVFVDGRQVAKHYDAFTPWDVVVPGLASGVHELVVEVDNSFGKHSGLHKENDYMTYGGLTRPVEFQYVPEVYIDKLFGTPVRRGKRWELSIRVQLANWSRKALKRRVVAECAGGVIDLGAVTVKPRSTRILTGVIRGLQVEAWTPASPALYYLEAGVFDGDELVDDKIDRVGFREVAVRGKTLLLNGKSIRLRGYNRHEDHPQFGNALPVEAMASDLEILRDLGCNFIRTCHYPNDRRFLDLCDEMGFAVWEESHARCVDFDHPAYKDQMTVNTTEMATWHHNHPSILIWGCLNECDSISPSGQREHARVLKLLKKLDPTRPVTFASNKQDNEKSFRHADICSLNVYNGWYRREIDQIEPEINRLLKWLDSPKSRGGSGKPVIMSEFGAGAIPGYRHSRRCHWTEEYQCDVLDESLRVFLNHPRIIGASIWQFCDVRVTKTVWGSRPRNMNNKGTVDEFRRPKLVYDVVKKQMHRAARKWDK